MKLKLLLFSILITGLSACTEQESKSDAYGNFEAIEYMISSEIPGKIIDFKVEEGQILKKNSIVAVIDTTLLHTQKQLLKATIKATKSKLQNVGPEIAVLNEQKSYLLHEKERLVKLVEGNAATQKQIDDLDSKIKVLDKKIIAAQSKVKDINKSILAQISPMKIKLKQVEEKIAKSKVINPIDGQVLSVFKRQGEIVGAGMPLYKIADLSTIELKAYITGVQLPHIKLNQEVTVLIDNTENTNKSYKGVISWISDKAEFTPKTIQTKEERVNLVYAIKVRVKNDGSMKIGMPGEVVF